MSSSSSTLRQLAELPRMPMADLKARWRELLGTEPPQYNREFLISRLAHRIQELTHGGLARAGREQMNAMLEAAGYDEIGREPKKRPHKGRPREAMVVGTRLVREWDGQRHEVTVVSGGFEYQGRRYRSLTAIADIISGTHWSGPSFFGLKRQSRRGGGV